MRTSFHALMSAAAFALVAALVPFSARAVELGPPTIANGFTFTNFDPTAPGVTGSNANGINNRGHVVVTGLNLGSVISNFEGTPSSLTALSLGPTGMALGINSGGVVVGTNNGAAFFMLPHGTPQTFAVPANTTNAFGIDDDGSIVGQFTLANGATPGFYLRSSSAASFITINAPSGPNMVNAQSVNNFGLIVGFYLGDDGQDHGFFARLSEARDGVLVGKPVEDPTIPSVPGEPGATFVFSQILSVNDAGIAVGYYGDSTNSQHGFIYNTNTGQYTFLDDPSEAFSSGVEITQITGIANSGELTGFYTDANGTPHSFTACPTYAYCPQ